MTATDAVTVELASAGYHFRVGSGWRKGDDQAPPDRVHVAVVKALQGHGQRASIRAVRDVMGALPRVESEPPPEPAADCSGLPLATVEELADEAAWWVDTFFMYSLTLSLSASWAFDNDDVDCSAIPADIRRTAFRAGMTVAAAHGVPDHAPTMRQVVNALIRRMAQDGRLKCS